MADVIDYEIHGDDMQIVEIELDPGEAVRAEAGALMFMTGGIQMQTSTEGGIFRGLKRMVTGESFFITSYVNGAHDKQQVAFGAPYPGKVIALDLPQLGGSFICQKDAFLCAASGIEIEVAFNRKIGAGLFGGEGFILQRLQGDGLAFIHAGGTIIARELSAGETIRVDTGCLAAMATSVRYNIQYIGGFRNALFGGEGIFLATVTGPGLIYLQSLPFSRLADRVMAGARSNIGEKKGVGGLGENVLGRFFGGDRS